MKRDTAAVKRGRRIALTRHVLLNLTISSVVFVATLAVLFVIKPLKQLPALDRMAFELGYYMALGSYGSVENRDMRIQEILRLSTAFGVPRSKDGDLKYQEDEWESQLNKALSDRLKESYLLGDYVGRIELLHLAQVDRPKMARLELELRTLAERSHLKGRATLELFLGSHINATELHGRLFSPEEPLRFQVDTDAGRRAFALGYYLVAACAFADKQNIANAVVDEIARLGNSLWISEEILPRSAAPHWSKRYCGENTFVQVSEHLGAITDMFFSLGRLTAVYELLRGMGANEDMTQVGARMNDVTNKLDCLSCGIAVAQFCSGKVDADRLYRELFSTKDGLKITFSGPPAKEPSP